ncbi:MAG: HAD superfamily hydrolase (TIGR01459 family) [Candidatus Midichloriaceae bacterium]|jgi:HAD superfamily hydrolase (TIGR01459 family)
MSILKNYDIILMDLWGVIYDGIHLYDGAVETLKKLKQLNKKVIFLSNVPRRSSTIEKMLLGFGIDKSLYFNIITSGEFVYHSLHKSKNFGKKYFYLGSPASEEVILNVKDYERVSNAKDADFSILAGTKGETGTTDYYEEALALSKEAIKYNLLLLCTNPDKTSITKCGEIHPCSGKIAEKYEESGGKVFYFGKPHKEFYEYALEGITNLESVLAIGDSLANDIRGANSIEINSVLVSSGVHRHHLEIKLGEQPHKDVLQALFEKYSTKPTYVVSLLKDLL